MGTGVTGGSGDGECVGGSAVRPRGLRFWVSGVLRMFDVWADTRLVDFFKILLGKIA